MNGESKRWEFRLYTRKTDEDDDDGETDDDWRTGESPGTPTG